jgi:hypothetical protein
MGILVVGSYYHIEFGDYCIKNYKSGGTISVKYSDV